MSGLVHFRHSGVAQNLAPMVECQDQCTAHAVLTLWCGSEFGSFGGVSGPMHCACNFDTGVAQNLPPMFVQPLCSAMWIKFFAHIENPNPGSHTIVWTHKNTVSPQ